MVLKSITSSHNLKSQAKSERYSRRNNIELSGIPNDIPEDIWGKLLLTFATIPMWKSSQTTLRDVIIYQFLGIVGGTLIKEA